MPTLTFTQEDQALQLELYFLKEIPKHSAVQTMSQVLPCWLSRSAL